MSDYTMSDVQEADRLWDEMPLEEIPDHHDACQSTILRWAHEGLISTEVNHHTDYDAQVIERADELWDAMPLSAVSELIDVPLNTLKNWSMNGWISTDIDWSAELSGPDFDVNPRRTVELYHKADLTYEEAAQQLGISPSTVGRHLRKYRNGEI